MRNITMQLLCLAICTGILMVYASGYDRPTPWERFVSLHLKEEQPAGTLVGNLSDSLHSLYGLELVNSKFHLVGLMDANDVDMFNVGVNGLMTAGKRIDRELVCPTSTSSQRNNDVCTITARVHVSSSDVVGYVYASVTIDDLNDHDPSFASETIRISLPESVASGTQIQLPIASDPDSAENGRLSYDLVPASDVFDVELLGGDVFLRLKTTLDREEQSVFSLLMVALDSGSPPRTGSLSIELSVSDVNDNPPRFTVTRYEFQTQENLPNGTVIGRVMATDADDGDNARVTYALARVNGHDSGAGTPLAIDGDSGDVTVVGELDFELCEQYVMTVIAADCALAPLRQFAYAQVVVHLTDTNDNAPKVTTIDNKAEVTENSDIGTPVLEISVFDADSGLAGQIESCTVTAADQPVLFSLHRRTSSYIGGVRYSLLTEAALDRETVDHYSLLITCMDAGIPPQTGYAMLDVDVLDINDNSPQFSNTTPTNVSLLEGNSVGDYVTTLLADDVDIGENGTVNYYIRCDAENTSSGLDINRLTGSVRAAVSLDREARSSYECIVTATDRGRPALNASTHLHLTVLDVDDELPVFESREYEFEFPENQLPGAVVGRVRANDADLSPFNNVVYALEIQNTTDDLPFRIDNSTGVIYSRRQLDRETDGNYFRFQVAAGSGSSSRLDVTDLATIYVHVTDINDNPPTILFPVCANGNLTGCELDVMEPPSSDVITRVIAVDPDDEGSPLLYELISNDVTDLFLINSSTGEVSMPSTAKPSLDSDWIQHVLSVRVTDSGNPPLATTLSFVIRLNLTRREQLVGDEIPTSTNLGLVLLAVGAAAIIIIIICFLAARRIGPVSDADEESGTRRSVTYTTASRAGYVSQTTIDDIDDVTYDVDCSTDVALGSSVRLQQCKLPSVTVGSVTVGTSVSARKPPSRSSVHGSPQAAYRCHDHRRVVVIQDHDICHLKRLDLSYETKGKASSGRCSDMGLSLGHGHHLPCSSARQFDHHRHCHRHGPSHTDAAEVIGEALTARDPCNPSTDISQCENPDCLERASKLASDTVADTTRRHDVDGRLARWRCGSCSIRQVALGAIVAGHVYNDADGRNCDLKETLLTGRSNCPVQQQQRRSLYL